MRLLPFAGVFGLIICACAPQNHFRSTIELEDCRELADKQKVRKGKNPKVTQSTIARPPRKTVTGDQDQNPSPFTEHPLLENQPVLASAGNEPYIFHYHAKESREIKSIPFSSDKITLDEPECPPASQEDPSTDDLSIIHSDQSKSDRRVNLLGISTAVAFLSLLTLSLFKSRAMRVSAWAAHHPRATKAILAAIHTATGFGSVGVGMALASEGTLISGESIGISAALAAAAATAYPRKKADLKNFSQNYLHQKVCDVALFVTGATMMAGISNHVYSDMNNPVAYVASVPASESMSAQTVTYTKATTFTGQRELQDPPSNKKVGLRILAISLFVIFTLGVAALSCAIACSGQGVLAILAAVALETLLVLALNGALRKINGTTRKKKSDQVEPIPQT